MAAKSESSTAPKFVTVRDVAELAGVSVITASRAIGGHRKVRPASAEKVMRAAEQLGYRPDAGARALRQSKTMTLGIVFDNLDSLVSVSILKGITSACQKAGYTLLVTNAQNDPETFKSLLQRLFERRVDGLFVVNQLVRDASDSFGPLQAAGVPILSLFFTSNEANRGLPVVTPREYEGVRRAVTRLLELGHRSFLQIMRPGQIGTDRDRAALDALAPYGGSAKREVALMENRPAQDDIEQQVVEALTRQDRPTAIIGSQLVIPTIYEAIRSLGLRIPEDVSVLSLLETAWTQAMYPPLATVRIDNEYLGQSSARVMLDWLNGQPPLSEVTYVADAEWMERGSVGPAPHLSSNETRISSVTIAR